MDQVGDLGACPHQTADDRGVLHRMVPVRHADLAAVGGTAVELLGREQG